ncbi:MerR family transcriptional regulator [Streptosporangium sp. NPDC049046]|uniref:MerR family transcriptional regulator n=1 Tax=Streptosporangium sp. NPDC049046 TaxID=3155031 RepID=UPI0034464853
MGTTGLSIGQVAERTGLSVHALRFYEREGILANPVRRDPGGRRVYGEDDVEWLTLCVILRASGMPLPAIRQYTEMVRRGDGNEEERLALLCLHRERVAAQIDQLSRCLDLINHKVGVYEDIVDRGGAGHECVAPPSSENKPESKPGRAERS